MPAGVSMDEYAEKTSTGMYKAQEAYEEWSVSTPVEDSAKGRRKRLPPGLVV